MLDLEPVDVTASSEADLKCSIAAATRKPSILRLSDAEHLSTVPRESVSSSKRVSLSALSSPSANPSDQQERVRDFCMKY